MFVVLLGVIVVLRLVASLLTLILSKKRSGLQKAFPYATQCFIVSVLLVELFLLYFTVKETPAVGSGLFVLIYLFVATFVFFENSLGKSVKFIFLYIGVSIVSASVLILLPAFLIRGYVMTYTMVGESMSPTLLQDDILLVQRSLYSLERGDMIVFTPPNKDIPFVKRVIGLPGEVVTIKEGSIEVCKNSACTILDEPYLEDGTLTNVTLCEKEEFGLTEGYFLLGDNRAHSTDSRCCFGLGCFAGYGHYQITQKDITGKVVDKAPERFLRMFSPLGNSHDSFK